VFLTIAAVGIFKLKWNQDSELVLVDWWKSLENGRLVKVNLAQITQSLLGIFGRS
jgi:hypothetical protein